MVSWSFDFPKLTTPFFWNFSLILGNNNCIKDDNRDSKNINLDISDDSDKCNESLEKYFSNYNNQTFYNNLVNDLNLLDISEKINKH